MLFAALEKWDAISLSVAKWGKWLLLSARANWANKRKRSAFNARTANKSFFAVFGELLLLLRPLDWIPWGKSNIVREFLFGTAWSDSIWVYKTLSIFILFSNGKMERRMFTRPLWINFGLLFSNINMAIFLNCFFKFCMQIAITISQPFWNMWKTKIIKFS